MIVNRHDQNSVRPVMTIYMRDQSKPPTDYPAPPVPTQPPSSCSNISKALPPAPGERIVEIDMTMRLSTEILQLFMAETQAEAISPSEADLADMQALDAYHKQSALDRARMTKQREEARKEKEMLDALGVCTATTE